MARHIVCLTFDFDAMSGWVARDMTTPTPVSRGEFGAVGATRILDLLARLGLPSTWFIPGVVFGTYPEICHRVHREGHEIGHHGWTHDPPGRLDRDAEARQLARGNEAIAALTGRTAQGYRSPSWDLSPNSIELLVEHGFVYESSMMGHDYLPYHARIGDQVDPDGPMQFGRPTALVEMPISWTLDDYPHFEFVVNKAGVFPGLAAAGGVLENWTDDFLYMKRELDWGVITYTCHPYVIGRGHRMLMLERLIERLQGEGAQFLTMEAAVAEYLDRTPKAAE